jgi:acetyltransferase-like isoleucine patch superfamily enzyme
MNPDRTLPWDWYPGRVPPNVALDTTAYVETTYSFDLFRSTVEPAITMGRGSAIYLGVMFDMGRNSRVKIGNFTLVHGARIICDSELIIGDYSLISWNVVFMDSYRMPFDASKRREYLERRGESHPHHQPTGDRPSPIRIGVNVWVGFDCCILPGVTIGDGSVIGARSVVANDIPAYCVAAGNPARVIRKLEPHDLVMEKDFSNLSN